EFAARHVENTADGRAHARINARMRGAGLIVSMQATASPATRYGVGSAGGPHTGLGCEEVEIWAIVVLPTPLCPRMPVLRIEGWPDRVKGQNDADLSGRSQEYI